MTEAAKMSDRAEMRGPVTRRRRTTISGGGNGAIGVKQANGSKSHEAGEKPPLCPAKAKKDEVDRHATNNGKVDKQMRVPGEQQLTNTPRKQRSAVEDINDRLRWGTVDGTLRHDVRKVANCC